MDDDLLELADRLWRGDVPTADHHPLLSAGGFVALDERTAFLAGFGNVSAFVTEEGLVLVDTGSQFTAEHVHRTIRSWTDAPLHTVIFTHGHIDHVLGLGPFESEAQEEGRGRPTVVAHEAVPARFDRYRVTAGWNAAINRRQFGLDELEWPTSYRYPDETYRDEHQVHVAGETFHLRHARGETDDATWVWVPDRGVLCTGDLFIWAFPNAGNPQKVQRYPGEWAEALRAMAGCGAEVLLPGHGLPIVGSDRVERALTRTAEALAFIHDATLERMNRGASLDDVLREVELPPALREEPYLQPVYDDPEFVIRTVWRRYGGWYDGEPAHLKPAPAEELAAEIASLSGGPELLARRAEELLASGQLRLAAHLASFALGAGADAPQVRATYARVYAARRDAEPSTMAKGIFGAAARGTEPDG